MSDDEEETLGSPPPKGQQNGQDAKSKGTSLCSGLSSEKRLQGRLAIVQSSLTIFAILGGAGWFWYQGSFGARITMSQEVVDVPINNEFAMVRVTTKISNRGLVAAKFNQRRISLATISPPERSFEESLYELNDTRINGRYVASFPHGAPPVILENEGSVEPGETEETVTEFVVLRCIRSVAVKSAMCSRKFDCFESETSFVRDTNTTHVLTSFLGEEECTIN